MNSSVAVSDSLTSIIAHLIFLGIAVAVRSRCDVLPISGRVWFARCSALRHQIDVTVAVRRSASGHFF